MLIRLWVIIFFKLVFIFGPAAPGVPCYFSANTRWLYVFYFVSWRCSCHQVVSQLWFCFRVILEIVLHLHEVYPEEFVPNTRWSSILTSHSGYKLPSSVIHDIHHVYPDSTMTCTRLLFTCFWDYRGRHQVYHCRSQGGSPSLHVYQVRTWYWLIIGSAFALGTTSLPTRNG
jgi:hypothetical protein